MEIITLDLHEVKSHNEQDNLFLFVTKMLDSVDDMNINKSF